MNLAQEIWLQRLRRALHGSGEQPRPLAPLQLPPALTWLLGDAALSRLRPAAVLVPVLVDRGEPRMLFTRRARSLRQHSGQISFPGGARDPQDETACAAALREAREEIGLPVERVEVIGYLDDFPTTTGYRVTPVVGLIDAPFTMRPAAGEVESVFAVPLAYALNAANYRWQTLTRVGVPLPFVELHYGAHRIWGATAGMLWNLLGKLDHVH